MAYPSSAFKPDPSIQQWVEYRENTLKQFRFTPRVMRATLVFGIALPYGMYKFIQADLNSSDNMGSESPGAGGK